MDPNMLQMMLSMMFGGASTPMDTNPYGTASDISGQAFGGGVGRAGDVAILQQRERQRQMAQFMAMMQTMFGLQSGGQPGGQPGQPTAQAPAAPAARVDTSAQANRVRPDGSAIPNAPPRMPSGSPTGSKAADKLTNPKGLPLGRSALGVGRPGMFPGKPMSDSAYMYGRKNPAQQVPAGTQQPRKAGY